MKISVVSMFANELAISLAFRDQLREFFDDWFLYGHNSLDNTADNFREEPQAILKTIFEPGYRQSELMTELMLSAFEAGADVVIPLDFDEFLPFDTKVDLEEFLQDNCESDVLIWNWKNIAPESLGIQKIFKGKFFYAKNFDSPFTKTLIFRSAWEKNRNITLSQGSHSLVNSDGLITKVVKDTQLLHIPIHGKFHYFQKMILGKKRMEEQSLGELGSHWKNHAELANNLVGLDDFQLMLNAILYPDLQVENTSDLRLSELDFGFPFVKHDYLFEIESAFLALSGNLTTLGERKNKKLLSWGNLGKK